MLIAAGGSLILASNLPNVSVLLEPAQSTLDRRFGEESRAKPPIQTLKHLIATTGMLSDQAENNVCG
jgi:hypothetical protein